MSDKAKPSKTGEPSLKDLGLDEPVKVPKSPLASAELHPPKIEKPVRSSKPFEVPPKPSPASPSRTEQAAAINSVGGTWFPLAHQYLYYGCIVGVKGTWVAMAALLSDTTVDGFHNYGLLAEQITGVVAGAALSICGAIWLTIGSLLMVAASAQMPREGHLSQSPSGIWAVVVTLIVSLIIAIFGSYSILGWSIIVLATSTIICLHRSKTS